MTQLQSRHLFTITIALHPIEEIGATPAGTRRVFPIAEVRLAEHDRLGRRRRAPAERRGLSGVRDSLKPRRGALLQHIDTVVGYDHLSS
jgi:hypothetical protein